jgi:hypothetical protein
MTAQKRHKLKRDLAEKKKAAEKEAAVIEKVTKMKEEFCHRTTQIS